MRRRLRRLADEQGLGLIECTVATGVMGIAVAGLAGAMTMGMGVTGLARQRSAASLLAAERIERARNVVYSQVALNSQPAHSADPDSPDAAVSVDGTSYDVGGGVYEPLVVDTADGAVRHVEDPVVVGTTELYIYQYVTWVDDNADAVFDYKRVTAVVTWRRALRNGVSSRIAMTTFIGKGSVTIPEATPTPAPSATPGPSPTASPTPTPGACPGDTTPPAGSVSIASGAGAETGYTNSLTLQVRVGASDACSTIDAELSNDAQSFARVTTLAPDAPATVAWSIPVGDGTRTVYARYVDAAGNVSPVVSAAIVLDQTKPTVPGDLRHSTCWLDGNDRTVMLTWDPSSDASLSGYRLYRSIESGAFTAVTTTSGASMTDTTLKTYDSVRYLVRAYDRAGNESNDSNIKTYTKNSC
jgi:Tfp pilus assembly protein PilV